MVNKLLLYKIILKKIMMASFSTKSTSSLTGFLNEFVTVNLMHTTFLHASVQQTIHAQSTPQLVCVYLFFCFGRLTYDSTKDRRPEVQGCIAHYYPTDCVPTSV